MSQWKIGTVRWFDSIKGEGIIRAKNGESFYVHHTAIKTDNPLKTLEKNKEVEFQLLQDSHFIQVDKVREVN